MDSLLLDEDDMEKTKTVNPPAQKKRQPKDKDVDPSAGSDQGLKKRKTSKDAKPSKKPKSIGSSKGTTSSQPKYTGKSVQAEETVCEVADTEMPMNQGDDMGNIDVQPNVEAALKHDWFTKPTRATTPDPEWNVGKSVNDEPE
ncbi:hypothetical protein Tco_0789641 [Tanacetum coccineum]